MQPDTDFLGADLPDGKVGWADNVDACCKACNARPECAVYTFLPAQRACYLKAALGWQRRTVIGALSAMKPGVATPALSPTPAPSPSPRPSLSPSPSPATATCAAVQQDVDFWGADLPLGAVTGVASVGACCAACLARPDCGSYTYVPSARVCYLKWSIGWEQRTGETGLQSGVVLGRQTEVVPVPAPPPVPGASPPPSGSTGDPYAPGPYKFVDLNDDQKRRMFQLTSIFENADVSGIVAGCAGLARELHCSVAAFNQGDAVSPPRADHAPVWLR